MNFSHFVYLMLALAGLYLSIGGRLAPSLKTPHDYFLGGRSLGTFSIAMTILATQIGGGTLIGAADAAYKDGWSILFYPLGMAIGLLLLGSQFGQRLRKRNLTTTVQIFEKTYRSVALRKIASFLSIISLFCVLIAIAIAMREFLHASGFYATWLFLLIWGTMVIYTVLGGLKAVIETDIVQMSFIVIVFFITAIALYLSHSPLLTLQWPTSLTEMTSDYAWTSRFFMPMLFMLIGQDMGQRCFAVRSPKIIPKATLFSAIFFLLLCCFPIVMGMIARQHSLLIPKEESVLMVTLAKFTSPMITLLFSSAVLMAIMSTGDSLICSISSNVLFDFFFHNQQNKVILYSAKGVTFLVGMAALACSYYFHDVLEVMIFAYELSVSALFVPLFFGLFSSKTLPRSSAWLSVLFGGGGFCLFHFYPLAFAKGMGALLLSLIGFFLGKLVAPEK